jgi:hypothetical protein
MLVHVATLLCVYSFYGAGVWFVIFLCVCSIKDLIDDNAILREHQSLVTEPIHLLQHHVIDDTPRSLQLYLVDSPLRPLQLHPVDGPMPDEFCVVCQDTGDKTEDWVTIEGCNRHRFHRECLGPFRGTTCMVCRAPLGL